jgi:putative pyrroloquinoline-quinone binding quinoprotein
MSVIELGEVAAGDGPVPPARARPVDRRLIRRLAAVLVVLLCLATVHSSAVPVAHGLVRTWSVPLQGGDSFALAGGDVFVLNDDAAQVLSAYPQAGGLPHWTQRLPSTATSLNVAAAAGVLLLPSGARSVGTRTAAGDVLWSRFSTRTVALDARTGRRLWTTAGDIALVTATSVLLVDYAADGSGTERLRLIRLRDGGILWARDAGGAYTWTALGPDPQRPTGLATATATGEIRVYRFIDGTEVTRGRVPWEAGSLTGATLSQLYGAGPLLYVFVSLAQSTTVTAYDPATLRRRWTITTGTGEFPAGCGAVLCVPVRGGLSGRDWATGAERWRTAAYELGRGMFGHLVLAGAERAGRAFLDDRTGRVLTDLNAGGAAWDAAAATVVAMAPTRSPVARLSVSRVDPRTGEAFLLGTIEPVINSLWCQLEGLRLACQSTRATLEITAVG